MGHASLLHHFGKHYVFGGCGPIECTRRIGRLDDQGPHIEGKSRWIWSIAGELNIARESMSVIFTGIRFLVVGGETLSSPTEKFSLERCQFDKGTEGIKCSMEKSLKSGFNKPFLYLINEEIERKCSKRMKDLAWSADGLPPVELENVTEKQDFSQ